MRITMLLLLTTCLASNAFAQATPPTGNIATPTGAAAAGGAIPSMVNGKLTVGYEGRGDYLKNGQLAKGNPGSTVKKPASNGMDVVSLDSKPAASAKPAATAAAATPAAPAASDQKLRSDATLASDTPKTQAAAAPVTATASAAKPTTSQTNAQNNAMPVVYRGGVLQK